MAEPISTGISLVVSKNVLTRIDKLTGAILDKAGKKVVEIFESWTAAFGEHLQVTYDRCSKVKTILNHDEPVDLRRLYVNAETECAQHSYDDVQFIDEIWKRKRLVLAGTGGGGKTIFMKYLWLSLFEASGEKIPLFIELRGYNSISSGSLASYVYETIRMGRAKITEDAFNRAIAAGLFIFMFDGFDEVIESKREAVEKEIQDLASNNPGCVFIVSSRPDTRFGAWQAFSTFTVKPLSKSQAISLVEKLDYDKDVKRLFISKLKSGLYESHESFLSTPLLCTMMLMTYRHFTDIPEKIHIFYEEAFNALFSQHDFSKGGFKREMKCGLASNDFKELWSYFCLISYYRNSYEFSDDEFGKIIAKASELSGYQVAASDFLHDLTSCVCLLQREGLRYVFSHRSFQEFFAAYCLARFPHEQMDQILDRLLVRSVYDGIIPMLYDMNSDLVEDRFILPRLRALVKKIESLEAGSFLEQYLAIMGVRLATTKDNRLLIYATASESDANAISLTAALQRIYRESSSEANHMHGDHMEALRHELDARLPMSKSTKKQATDRENLFYGEICFVDGVAYWKKTGDEATLHNIDWVKDSTLHRIFRCEADWLISLLRKIEGDRSVRLSKIDDVFGLDS